MVYVVNLDMVDYITVPAPVRAILKSLAAVGCKPLHSQMALLEIPLVYRSGFFAAAGTSRSERNEAFSHIVQHVREKIDYDLLFVRIDDPAHTADQLAVGDGLGLLRVRIPPNSWLDFPASSFSDFIDGLPAHKRYQIRKNIRIFSRSNGRILPAETPKSGNRLFELYQSTVANAERKGSVHHVVVPTREYFSSLGDVPNCQTWLAQLGDVAIGFMTTVRSNNVLFVKHVGLNYKLATPTRAYFNLFYHALQVAADSHCTAVDYGPSTYTFKQRLGCVLVPCHYAADFGSLPLRLVKRFFERRIRKMQDSNF